MNLSPDRLGFSTLDEGLSINMLPVRGAIPSWLKGTLMRTTLAVEGLKRSSGPAEREE